MILFSNEIPDIHLEIQREWKRKILFNEGSDSARGVAILFKERLDFELNIPSVTIAAELLRPRLH